ncbi:MAG: L-fucose mutarotase [Ruminococcaceae bacterium]|nr:L-fucose mutarotase [Oscillospiraceae bacterium]
MLKGINKIITPDLLYVLAQMGHGDEIVISDGNFPGETMGKRTLRADGSDVPELLSAVLELFPLDTYAPPVYLMDKTAQDKDLYVPIWEEYRRITAQYTDAEPVFLERFEFYERAKNAFAVVVTGESAIYANIIIKKGVVK